MAGKITQAAEIELSVKGAGTVKSIKTELREAKEQAIAMSREFGEFSPQAIAATKRMAELKDEMEDFGHRVNALNPDKFSQIGTAAQSLAHGFSAAQGAAALFGAESENVQKAMMQVQGAMALSQGLMGLKDAKEGLLALAGTIKSQVVAAFSTMKGAIMSTGIGALIIGVGSLIAYFKHLSNAAERAAEEEKKAFDAKKKFADSVLGLDEADIARAKAIDTAKAKNKGATNEQLLQLERDYLVKSFKAQERHYNELKGVESEATTASFKALQAKADAVEIFDLEQETKAAEKAKEDAKKAAEEYGRKRDTAIEAQRELQEQLKLSRLSDRDKELEELKIWTAEQSKTLKAGGQSTATLIQLAKEKERQIRQTWAEEDLKIEKENNAKKLEVEKQFLEDQKKLAEEEFQKTQQSTNDYFLKEKTNLVNQLTEKKITRDEYLSATAQLEVSRLEKTLIDARDYGQSTLDIEKQIADNRLASADEATKKQIDLNNKERESRLLLLNSTLSAVKDLGVLLANEGSKAAKVQKAFALAQIGIDTAQAISSLMKNSEANPANAVTGGIAGIAQFASGIARIIANVAKATQLLKAPSPSLGSGAGGGGASPEPAQFSAVGQDIKVSKLGDNTQGGTGDKAGPQKVFVVESDIRKVSRRVEVVENGGTL